MGWGATRVRRQPSCIMLVQRPSTSGMHLSANTPPPIRRANNPWTWLGLGPHDSVVFFRGIRGSILFFYQE
jgi:hypothetical protein